MLFTIIDFTVNFPLNDTYIDSQLFGHPAPIPIHLRFKLEKLLTTCVKINFPILVSELIP